MTTQQPVRPQRVRGTAMLLLAATSYGSQGIFYTLIEQRYGADAGQLAFLRVLVSFTVLAVGLIVFRRDMLRVHLRDLPLLLANGAFGYAAFYLVYTKTVLVAGVSTAAVLQETAPIWVSIFAWRFLGEGFGWRKAIALVIVLSGIALVSQAYDVARLRLNDTALTWGLAAGVVASLYILLNRYAVARYSAVTVTVYAQASAVAVLALFSKPTDLWQAVSVPGAIPWYLALGIVSCLLGAVLYPAALKHLGASASSILGSWEPVTALILAFLILGERLEALQLVGAILVIGGIVLLATGEIMHGRASAAGRIRAPGAGNAPAIVQETVRRGD